VLWGSNQCDHPARRSQNGHGLGPRTTLKEGVFGPEVGGSSLRIVQVGRTLVRPSL